MPHSPSSRKKGRRDDLSPGSTSSSPKAPSPRRVIVDPKVAKLARLKKWSMAHANKLPATFSPQATKLQATLSTATLEDAKAWVSGERQPPRNSPSRDLHVEAESRERISSIIPPHRIVRGVYSDLSLAGAKKKRAKLLALQEATRRGRPRDVPDYEFELRKLKAEKAANRPSWDSTTAVVYPRLDPRQLERSNTAGSPLRGSGSGATSPSSSIGGSGALSMTAFPVTPSAEKVSSHKKYIPSRRSLDPIRHVKREQGNVIKVLTAMKTDANAVTALLQKDDDHHRALAASEYTKLGRFMANAAISRVEKAAVIDVDVSVPQTMQEQMSAMTEEMFDAAVQVKQLRDLASLAFVWEIQSEIERLLDEAPPITREIPAVLQALRELEGAVRTHKAALCSEFPCRTSSIEHALENVDDPLPLPSVVWGDDVATALGTMAKEGQNLNALAEDTLESILYEKAAVEARMERDRQQRELLQNDVLGPGNALLAEILAALESMPAASGFQGARGLVSSYDRARAVLAVVERAWGVEVDMTSSTHVDEVLETLVEYSAVFLDAAQRAYRLVVGVRECAGEIEALQGILGAVDTPQQILKVPAVMAINKFFDEQIGRTQGSVWNCRDTSDLYPNVFDAQIEDAVADELAEFMLDQGARDADNGNVDGDASGDPDDDLEIAPARQQPNKRDATLAVSTHDSASQNPELLDEDVLREPEWFRVKVDQMTRSMEDLRQACSQTRQVIDEELPLIQHRAERDREERTRMKSVVAAAAGMLTHFEALLERSHAQLRLVPEVASKMETVRAAISEVTGALKFEVDLTTPEKTDTALALLDERSEAALALAKELALRIEVHAAELEARVRRETLGRQKLNREKMPALRASLGELEQLLEAAHPQLRAVDSVASNHIELSERFHVLQADLRACVDVTSQDAMDTALKSLGSRCEELSGEAQFVLALVHDEQDSLAERLSKFKALRQELEAPLMWGGVGHYETAVTLFNDAPEQLRGLDGEAARAIASGKDKVDAMVEAWKVTPNLSATTAAATASVLDGFRKRGEQFRDDMLELENLLWRLVNEMNKRLDAEKALRAEIQEQSLGAAHSQIVSISDTVKQHPHMQDEGHHVTVVLRALSALALDTDGHMKSITVDVTSDEAMAKDMAKLREHANVLDEARASAQSALKTELERIAARRKVIVDAVNEIRDTLLLDLIGQQTRFDDQVAEAPPKFGKVAHVASLQIEIRGLIEKAKCQVEGLLDRANAGADLVANDEAGLAAVAALRKALSPMQIRCAEIHQELDSEMARLLERQAEDAKRRADLRSSRLMPAETILDEVRGSIDAGGERLRSDEELSAALNAAAASVAKCHHLLERRLDYTTAESMEEEFQELLQQLARENTLERCESARALLDALIERVRATDSQFWTNAGVAAKMLRRARKTKFKLQVANWKKNRLVAADALRQSLEERGRRLHRHPQYGAVAIDHATNDGESRPGGKEMTRALQQSGDGAAEHWDAIGNLRATAVAALGTTFESIGKERSGVDDPSSQGSLGGLGVSPMQRELEKIERPLADFEAELKRTKLRFDGLEKRLAAALDEDLRKAADQLEKDEVALMKASSANAQAALAAVGSVGDVSRTEKQAAEPAQVPTEEDLEVKRVAVASTAAVRLQKLFRDRRAKAMLAQCQFSHGEVHNIEPEIMSLASKIDDTVLEQQARIAFAWDTPQFIRTVTVQRGEGWKSQSLGIAAELPAQYDLDYLGYEMRVSDPYMRVTKLEPTSCFQGCGIRPEDGIITVNGKDFDTMQEFAELCREKRDMVLEVAFLPDTPGWDPDNTKGHQLLEPYKRKVRNAVAMRVMHEVRVRDQFEAAHAQEAVQPERHIPEMHIDKVRCMETLLSFLRVQDLSNAHAEIGPSPILCAIATAVEETGVLPLASRRSVGTYAKPDPQTWLSQQIVQWQSKRAEALRVDAIEADSSHEKNACISGIRPSPGFLSSYKVFAAKFPKDFGRRDGVVAQITPVSSETGEEKRSGAASQGNQKLKRRKGKKGVKQGPRPEGKKGESWDVLHAVDGLVKTASGRYVRAAED